MRPQLDWARRQDCAKRPPAGTRCPWPYGGISSLILNAVLLLASPAGNDPVGKTVKGGGVPFILSELPSALQDSSQPFDPDS